MKTLLSAALLPALACAPVSFAADAPCATCAEGGKEACGCADGPATAWCGCCGAGSLLLGERGPLPREGEDFPAVTGALCAKVFAEKTTHATDPLEEVSDVRSHSHLDLGLHASRNFSVVAGFNLEEGEGLSTPDGEDRFFQDHTLFVYRLYALWHNDRGDQFFAGKFDPHVGLDMHDIPGMYGHDVFEQFALQEKLGVGFSAPLVLMADRAVGHHRLECAAFRDDNTFLSESLLRKRGHLDHDDGGAGNSTNFDNFSARVAGEDFLPGAFEGLGYAIGTARQQAGVDGTRDENRFVLALDWKADLADRLTGRLIAENTWLWNKDGQGGDHHRATTLGGELRFAKAGPGDIRVGGTMTWDAAGRAAATGSGLVAQASVGYVFTRGAMKGFSVDAGFLHQVGLDDENADRVGVMVGYTVAF